MEKIRIRIYPDGIEGFVEKDTTILEGLEKLGIKLETLCGGAGWCGQCIVKVNGALSEISSNEKSILSNEMLIDGYRLACQAVIKGNIDIEIPPQTRLYGNQILTSGVVIEKAKINPDVKTFRISLPIPSLEDQRADLERLEDAIGSKISVSNLDILKKLPIILRESNFDIEAVIYRSELIDIRKPISKPLYGVAIDIGTTTIVAYLLDLKKGEIDVASSMNPQAKRGADVISRIDYSIRGGLQELRDLVVGEINRLIEELCNRQSIEPTDIYDITIVGNTTMMHIFLGVPPNYIAVSPYIPTFTRSMLLEASQLGIHINPRGKCYVLPNISGYVGADTVGVVLATRLYKGDGVKLALDIGTNGEMVLKDGDKLFACSTAAGPAFEGANITYGMRGAKGAIDHINIDDGKINVHVIGDVQPIGICGSGLLDAIAVMIELGILDETGKIVYPEGELIKDLIRKTENGLEFLLRANGGEILINQRDVRELQLAKSAIRAGIEILLEETGRDYKDIDTVYLAGAFGTYLNPESAVKIGLLPPIPIGRIYSVGNAAGEGAKLALLDKDQRRIAEEISKNISYIELSSRRDFQEKFMEFMYFETKR
ncbi:MAG: ASKHA domain-containing protein [bacterium]|nr:ASKHA domain-containing protein [bacterium]